jgi:hypothetical protein
VSDAAAIPYYAAYSCTKAALKAYADALRLETLGTGVTIHVALPGAVATPMQSNVSREVFLEIQPPPSPHRGGGGGRGAGSSSFEGHSEVCSVRRWGWGVGWGGGGWGGWISPMQCEGGDGMLVQMCLYRNAYTNVGGGTSMCICR